MIVSFVQTLIGQCPTDYEPLQYMICGVVLIFMLAFVYRFIRSIFRAFM